MRVHRTGLDLDTTDYSINMDPSYTMLEFDSLRALPEEAGMFDPLT